MADLTPQLVPLERLKPAPWNPRLIRDARFKNLCKSIAADPDLLRLRPILAQEDGTIYAGNMRYRAVEHLAPTVLDLFGGSGSTLIACEQLDRRGRLMEIDPAYCDVIVRRWETLTGRKAER